MVPLCCDNIRLGLGYDIFSFGLGIPIGEELIRGEQKSPEGLLCSNEDVDIVHFAPSISM